MAARHFKPKACAWCGTEFTPNSARSKYCTPEHYEDAHRKQALDRYYENRQKDPAAIRERDRAYYEANKERIHKQASKRYKANIEHIRKRDRTYRQANREKIQRQARAYYENNKARILEYSRTYSREWRAANPEREREQRRRWRANNPDKVGKAAARRAQAELEGNSTPQLIEAKWEAGDKTCILCGDPIDDTLPPRHPASRTLEHVTPIVRGGTNDIDNIDFAHHSCNSSKGAKTLEEYRAWQARLQQAS